MIARLTFLVGQESIRPCKSGKILQDTLGWRRIGSFNNPKKVFTVSGFQFYICISHDLGVLMRMYLLPRQKGIKKTLDMDFLGKKLFGFCEPHKLRSKRTAK